MFVSQSKFIPSSITLGFFLALNPTAVVYASNGLSSRFNQIIIQGKFSEVKPRFLVLFSNIPLNDAQINPLLTANWLRKNFQHAWVYPNLVAIRLYGKEMNPHTQQFEYYFGGDNPNILPNNNKIDANRPWNNGQEFAWQTWETLSPDIWDNIAVIPLPLDVPNGPEAAGEITNILIRKGGNYLFHSGATVSAPNHYPIDASFPAFNIAPKNGRYPLLNLASNIAKFKNDFYELADNPILVSAFAELGQTDGSKYTSDLKWCSEFIAHTYKQNGYVIPSFANSGLDVGSVKNYFRQNGKLYTLREVTSWSNYEKRMKIKPGSWFYIPPEHAVIFNSWVTYGKTSLNQYSAISGNNLGMVWSHSAYGLPLSLPNPASFSSMTPKQLKQYDQKYFVGVPY